MEKSALKKLSQVLQSIKCWSLKYIIVALPTTELFFRPVVVRPAVPGGGHHDLRAALHLGGLQELALPRHPPRQLRLRTHRQGRIRVRDNVSKSFFWGKEGYNRGRTRRQGFCCLLQCQRNVFGDRRAHFENGVLRGFHEVRLQYFGMLDPPAHPIYQKYLSTKEGNIKKYPPL